MGVLFTKHTLKSTIVYKDPQWESDTVGYYRSYNTKVRKIGIANFIDFSYKISDKYTFINGLGVKIESPNGVFKNKSKDKSGYIVSDSDHTDANQNKRKVYPYYNYNDPQKSILPFVVKLQYSPQLLVHFKAFSLNINLIQDFLVINKLSPKMNLGFYNTSTYTGLGLFFMPHIKAKIDEEKLLKDDFDY